MPTVSVKKRQLVSLFGNLSDEEVDHLLFRFGLELDEITQENFTNGTGETVAEVVYKIEVPANRYDLLCVEGLVMALHIFFKSSLPPKYTVKQAPKEVFFAVDPSVAAIRPYIVSAVLRNVLLTEDDYDSLIDLQEKLHHNACRKRTLVAIGVHDLDTLRPPFLYTTKSPKEIRFKALNQNQEHTAVELMQLYSRDLHLKQYLHIIEAKPRYPVIYDASGVVLSMPPIINGDHSKVSTSTKNILIECTAVDLRRAEIVLETLVCALSQHCRPPFTTESVRINLPNGDTRIYPTLPVSKMVVSVGEVNRLIGVELNAGEIGCFLKRMGLDSVPQCQDHALEVTIPPNRHDILHVRDIVEDIAIAYGYNKITEALPPVVTIGQQTYLNKMTETLRREIAAAGFTEVLTFALCGRDDISVKLNRPDGLSEAVVIGNPKTQDFQVARTRLLPGILKTIHYNRDSPLPLKLFEIQDVVLKRVEGSPVNRRHFCAVYYGKTSGFEVIHGLLDHLMALLCVQPGRTDGYWLKEAEDGTCFAGRCAAVHLTDCPESIGFMGIVRPDVIRAFGLNLVCSYFEIDFEQVLSAANCS